MDFVPLENHSVYSLCEGTAFMSELAAHAKAGGEEYLAVCDTNGFYGVVRFLQECRQEGLKPVVAARLRNGSFNGILVARNMKGYAQMCSLITGIHQSDAFNLKREILRKPARNYFVITRDREVLKKGAKGVFAEINVLRRNYASDRAYATRLGVPPVFISPVYFLRKEDHHLHLLLQAIARNTKLSSLPPGEIETRYAYPRSREEIASTYAPIGDALRNTMLIARKSQFDFPLGTPIFPKFCDNSFERLKSLCLENLEKRYPRATPPVHRRLEKELDIIERKGFADYFLVVHDFVKHSPYTCGRGSAAASLVSYLLFITHVDPLRHNLFFERFLNEERRDPPDIDVDFPWDTRDLILDYIFRRYSKKNAAMVSNHITFSSRSSVREVAKVYGVPEHEISGVTRNIGYYYDRSADEFREYAKHAERTPLFRKIFQDAVEVHGRPRHLSVHCGGVVITPKPIYYYIPVERAPKGVNIIQLEKDQAEDFGFVKIDVLGNRSLAVVRDCLELIEKHYGEKIRYEEFNPLNDRRTIEMLGKGETIGVFYTESPAMRQLQKKTGRGDYEHLVIHSSIIRPAANIYIHEYVERLRGKPWEPLLPEMGEILKDSYGIMCYQEDITRIALEIAGMPLGEADEIRKVILRRDRVRRKLELKDRFYEGLRRKSVPERITERIWEMIESFSGYSFCKPHSASFALLSFKCCYLKAHYPAEFMGAVLKNQGGYYSPLAYISEARRMGLRVELPDINVSLREYFGQGNTISMGFMQIKNLSSEVVTRLVEERERRGHYEGLVDFARRTGAGLADTVILIKAGCFRNVERYNQPQLLFMARNIRFRGENRDDDMLYDLSRYSREVTPPPMRDIDREQKLRNEQELFGFMASIHPMEYYRRFVRDPQVIPARDLERYTGRTVKVAGILVTAKTVLTKNAELMQFVSFEDETTIFETVLFPRVHKKNVLKLSNQQPYVLTGRVDAEFGVISLNVFDIEMILGKRSPATARPSMGGSRKQIIDAAGDGA
jgi:DNA-directed DNA polymerase III PolC